MSVDGSSRGLGRTCRDPGCVRLDVIVEAAGIRIDELAKVFPRFQTSDRSRSGGESGLGGAMANEHALGQGESLSADNEPGRGAGASHSSSGAPEDESEASNQRPSPRA